MPYLYKPGCPKLRKAPDVRTTTLEHPPSSRIPRLLPQTRIAPNPGPRPSLHPTRAPSALPARRPRGLPHLLNRRPRQSSPGGARRRVTGDEQFHGSHVVNEQPHADELPQTTSSRDEGRVTRDARVDPSGPREQAFVVPRLRSDVRAKMLLVLAAMHALPSNGRTVTASVRELQKKTGFSRGAVSRAIQRCVEAGWIQRTGNRRKSPRLRAADSYRLLAPAPTLPSWLWSTHGLGATAFLLFDATPTHQAAKTQEIAASAGVSVSTAQRRLRELLSVGIVDNPKRGWWIRYADSDYLHQVAEFLTHEAKTKRIRLIRQEQAEYKAFDDWYRAQARRARVGRTKRSQPGR